MSFVLPLRIFSVAALALAFAMPLWTAQAVERLPAHLFAQREKMWGPALSPDGTRIAVLERGRDDELVVLYTIDGSALRRTAEIPSGTGEDYYRVRWANTDRLIVSALTPSLSERTSGTSARLRRVISMNVDGSDPVTLLADRRTRPARFSGDGIIHMLPDSPAYVLVRLIDVGNDNDSSVYRMNIYSGEKVMVGEAASGQDIYSWFADWDGTLRYAFGEDSKNRPIMLIRRADGSWYPLHKYELFADGRFFPLGFNHDDNRIYVLSNHITGRASLYLFDLRTGDLDGKVFGHDEVDLDSLVISEAQRKAVAVSYTLDKKEYHFLDADYESLRAEINQALPGRINAVVSNTPDENLLVVMSESPIHSGAYYLYDRDTQRLTKIGERFDGLNAETLSPMTRVTYEARDSLEIPSYLTVPKDHMGRPGPAVVLPHGGPRTRDRLGFDLWAQFLANRGYVVLQPNFRGSRGYGERYESLGHGTWGRAMQDDLTDAAQWLVEQDLADPDRICMVGGSYGGYAAVLGLIRSPGVFQCAASLNGVTDIRRMLREDGDYDSRSSEFRRVAGRLSKSELDLISPIDRADEITAPVLLVHGEDDRNVSIRHSRQLANKLARNGTPHTFIALPDDGHTLRREENLLTWLQALERFLDENIGGDGFGLEAAAPEDEVSVLFP